MSTVVTRTRHRMVAANSAPSTRSAATLRLAFEPQPSFKEGRFREPGSCGQPRTGC